nr:EAL domain-containing protein [Parazoarcus communis]
MQTARPFFSIAQPIDASVVSEGVELANQARFVETLENASLQGWYVARPMPVAGFEKWMDAPPQPKGDSQ